jgi:hypothetical protein
MMAASTLPPFVSVFAPAPYFYDPKSLPSTADAIRIQALERKVSKLQTQNELLATALFDTEKEKAVLSDKAQTSEKHLAVLRDALHAPEIPKLYFVGGADAKIREAVIAGLKHEYSHSHVLPGPPKGEHLSLLALNLAAKHVRSKDPKVNCFILATDAPAKDIFPYESMDVIANTFTALFQF